MPGEGEKPQGKGSVGESFGLCSRPAISTSRQPSGRVYPRKPEKVRSARQVQKLPVSARSRGLLFLVRSQPRGPSYEDWFHEAPRARPARLLRTRQKVDTPKRESSRLHDTQLDLRYLLTATGEITSTELGNEVYTTVRRRVSIRCRDRACGFDSVVGISVPILRTRIFLREEIDIRKCDRVPSFGLFLYAPKEKKGRSPATISRRDLELSTRNEFPPGVRIDRISCSFCLALVNDTVERCSPLGGRGSTGRPSASAPLPAALTPVSTDSRLPDSLQRLGID
ncbi:hypothetical protein KM043_013200 [Ampulex compressa]|nr:hypothetical protein KM043_013200 [Ampulex compressa]